MVELFTDETVYRSHPFREPAVGRDVAVEWLDDDGGAHAGPITLPGCFLLRFSPDGRCEELRQYWHLEHGTLEAHPGGGVERGA